MTADQLKEIIRQVLREELQKVFPPLEQHAFLKAVGEIAGLREDIERLDRKLQDSEILRQLAQRDPGSEIRF